MIFKKSKDLQVYEEKDDTPKTNTDFVDYDGHQGHHIHQSKMFDMEFYDSQKNSFGVYSRVIKECDEQDQKFDVLESKFKVPQPKTSQQKNMIKNNEEHDLVSMASIFCLCHYSQARFDHRYPTVDSKQLSKSDINLAILKNYDYEIVVKDNPISGHQYTVFKCTYKGCNKEMETTWNMLDHARMHKGIKPYVCCFCNKRFTQKGNMRKHAKLHLTPHVDARRKYKCEYCGGGFTEKYNLMVRIHYHFELFFFIIQINISIIISDTLCQYTLNTKMICYNLYVLIFFHISFILFE